MSDFWSKVVWSPPDGHIAPICSACQGPIPDIPLRLWNPAGWTAHFCDACAGEVMRNRLQIK